MVTLNMNHVNGALRTIVNNLFYESLDTTLMWNIKSRQNIFLFSHKKFLKIFSKLMPLGHSLTFQFKYWIEVKI